MADFFEDLGKKVTDVASEIGKRAEDTIEIQKLKSEVRSLKRGNERDYKDIGRMVYEKFQKHEILELDLIPLCEAIEKREEGIEDYEVRIARIQEEV